MSEADWTKFEWLCLKKLIEILISSTAIDDYISIFLTIADDSIPKTSCKSIDHRNSRFNGDCKEVLQSAKETYVI
ncbi:hypothetical protein [Solemya velum gill symbiont]|uniref:hypothetical protein n=1 Tax=Solemya velum gill symbiont TaxID=2340 RepID=UPI00117BD0AA|nr:hypothetical protein [Solemya velum gill symbiont]